MDLTSVVASIAREVALPSGRLQAALPDRERVSYSRPEQVPDSFANTIGDRLGQLDQVLSPIIGSPLRLSGHDHTGCLSHSLDARAEVIIEHSSAELVDNGLDSPVRQRLRRVR